MSDDEFDDLEDETAEGFSDIDEEDVEIDLDEEDSSDEEEEQEDLLDDDHDDLDIPYSDEE